MASLHFGFRFTNFLSKSSQYIVPADMYLGQVYFALRNGKDKPPIHYSISTIYDLA
ncbi:6072_t:CDS:2, partial [Ambispora gerdemannii]